MQKMGPAAPARSKEHAWRPEGQNRQGAAALACFLIILSHPRVGDNFKKTLPY